MLVAIQAAGLAAHARHRITVRGVGYDHDHKNKHNIIYQDATLNATTTICKGGAPGDPPTLRCL